MAVESPTNCWTRAEARIMTALSNSAAFLDLTEAADATDALTHIFGEVLAKPQDGHAYTLEELQRLNAYGQVYSADEAPYGKQWVGSRLVPYGSVIIYIERWAKEYEGHNEVPLEIERKFKNRAGDIMQEVCEYLEENSGPFIRGFVVSQGPGMNDPEKWEEAGMCQGIEFTADWAESSEV